MSEKDKPTRYWGAICPHSGGLPAEEFFCHKATFKEALEYFWLECVGSRYVGRVYVEKLGRWVKVWEEGQPHPIEEDASNDNPNSNPTE